MFYIQEAAEEVRLAYYKGKLAAWKDAHRYLENAGRCSVEVAREAELVGHMIKSIEEKVRKYES